MKAGLVLVNYNGSELLQITLHSLLCAKVNTPFVVCLVENGSDKSHCEMAREAFSAFTQTRGAETSDLFIRSEKNLGFCGGNNLGIRKLLEDTDIDRICLLNTDVIVTDGWLDLLMESDADIVGPVTNANGNEQTVWVDYQAEKNSEAFKAVNEFASFRKKVYRHCEVSSACVTGFCSLIKREVFEKIGLLDEQFFPGGFDDCDFDQRLLAEGGSIAIRRDCYLHHWGSGSFAKLSMSERMGISIANMDRYEKKWHTEWKGTQRLLPISMLQDMEHLKNNSITDERAWNLIRKTGEAIGKILEARETAQIRSDRNTYRREVKKQLEAKIQLSPIAYVPDPEPFRFLKEAAKSGQTLYHSLRAPGRRKHALEDVLAFIRRGKETTQGTIAILAPFWREEKLKDGYFQRIVAADRVVLKDYYKLYFESDPHHLFSVEKIDERHMVIHFPVQNQELLPSLKMLMSACGIVYAHSLLRFVHSEIDPQLLQWLTEGHVKLIWDVHGAVPEEAAFYDNWVGAQTYQILEEILAQGAGAMICVNHAMQKHLEEKYDYLGRLPRAVVMPILPEIQAEPEVIDKKLEISDYRRPVAVYAGGLQLWQNVALMQDVMSRTGELYRYDMVVSNPAEFMKQYGDRKMPPDTIVHSLLPEKVREVYAKSHFGFVLRDDVTVNNVACPTKLIEYICFGVLPVMKTTQIGDFVPYGMEYISVEDFEKGHIPSALEFTAKIRRNGEVLKKIQEEFTKGQKALLSFIEGGDEKCQ